MFRGRFEKDMNKKAAEFTSSLAVDMNFADEDIEAFINKVNEKVTGSVRVKLYKGSARIVGRKSDYALYSLSLASYDKKKDLFNHKSAVGFIELFGLQSILANKIRMDMDAKHGKGKK